MQPILNLVLITSNNIVLLVINIICLILFTTDTIISLNVAKKFKKTIIGLNVRKDSSLEFTKLVRETIKNSNKIFQNRLFMAFPNIDLKKLRDLKNDFEDDIKEFLKK